MLAKIEDIKNPYAIALTSAKIVEMKKSESLSEFADIISTVYFNAGQKSEKEMLKALCIALHDEVKKYFPFLRMDELRIAFANGVRGEYRGEKDSSYIGINIASFNQWIKGYLNDQRRKDAKLAIQAASERVYAPSMSKTEAEYEWKRTIIGQFNKFKETGVLHCDFPNHLFQRLEERGLLVLSNEQKNVIMSEAKERLLNRKKIEALNPLNKSHFKELLSIIQKITDGTTTSVEQALIKTEARRIAIMQYYQTIETLNL